MNTPHFLLAKSVVLEQYRVAANASDLLSYSSKTNPLITSILENETADCFFSVHLHNELINITDKSRVLFLAQAWTSKDIELLIAQQVSSFVVDNKADLNTLLEFLEQRTAVQINHLFLRIKLKELSLRTEKHYVFGMDSEFVNKKISEIHESSLRSRIKNLGVHFHRKTQNMSEWNLMYETENMLSASTRSALDVINIGGGLPAAYASTNVDVIPTVLQKISAFKAWLHEQNILLMIEPGRFISAPSVKLVTTIIGMHDNTLIVDASVYNSDMDALIVPVKLLVEGELSQDEVGENYCVKGITPCSMDLFRYRVKLRAPQIGDSLIFLHAGAYNFTTDFCNLQKIETVIVDEF
ncbi:MAG: decarboxylase [Candidatus Woesearchaeota archaeon]|nr:MAG: decarboxylase [Candidatus Woesearchaeota archaeon]